MKDQLPVNFRKNKHKFILRMKKRFQNSFNYTLERNQSVIKNGQGFFFALLIAMIFIFLNACTDPVKIALETKDYRKGKEAVWRITDQSKLTKVAMEAVDQNVRCFAVEKITDHFILEKIAVKDKSYMVGRAAVKKLTDQSQIVKIALEAESYSTRAAATEMLTDPILLSKLALESKNRQVREATVKKLTEPEMRDVLANVKDDRNAQLFNKLICAFDGVPQKHQARLIQRILPAIIVLNKIEIKEIFGEIISFRFDWSSTSAFYSGDKSGYLKGESFQCQIKLKNIDKPLYKSWSTKFPKYTSSFHFQNASIDLGDLLEPVFNQLSQSSLENIITDDLDSGIKNAAKKKLNILHKTGQ